MPATNDSSSPEYQEKRRKHKHKRRSRSESPMEKKKRHKHRHKHKSEGSGSDSPHSSQPRDNRAERRDRDVDRLSEEDQRPVHIKEEPSDDDYETTVVKREEEDNGGSDRHAERTDRERVRHERRPVKRERWDRDDQDQGDDRDHERRHHRDRTSHSRDRHNAQDQRQERFRNDRRREDRRRNQRGNPFEGSGNQSTEQWGRQEPEGSAPEPPKEKEQPNFELSGKLTEETNTYKGVVIKYNEPPEARKSKKRWRLYPFKGDQALPVLHIHRQSAFLLGRERKIADIPVDHPSCSKQHAVLQYRLVSYEKDDGTMGQRVKPYIIDLGSANGTYLNNQKIEAQHYVELREKDVLKFGFSSREYVLLHDSVDTTEVQEDD